MHRRIGEDDTSIVEPEQYIPLRTCIFHMESTTQLWEPTSSASPFPPHIPSDWIRDWEKMTVPSWNRTGIFPYPLPHFTQNVPQNRQFCFSILITYSIKMHRRMGENDSSIVEPEHYLPLPTCTFHTEWAAKLVRIQQFRFSIPVTYSIQNASTNWRNDSSVLKPERSSSEQPRTHLPEVLVCAVCSLQFCCLRMRASCVLGNFLLNRLDVECEDLGNSLLNVSSEESVMKAVR
jgi:hypothetical protein